MQSVDVRASHHHEFLAEIGKVAGRIASSRQDDRVPGMAVQEGLEQIRLGIPGGIHLFRGITVVGDDCGFVGVGYGADACGDGQQDRLDNEQGGGILVQSVDRRQQVVERLEMVAQMIEGDPEGDPGISCMKQCVEGLMLPAQIKGVGVKGAMPAEAPAINTVSAGRSLNAAPLRRVAP